MADNKNKKTVLGRGLKALLPDAGDDETIENQIAQKVYDLTNFKEIDINSIEVNIYQPRTEFNDKALDELAESIKVQGIIQPITVRKLSDNRYQIISGERRYRAAKKIGLQKIPAYIRTANDQQMLELALIENIQRQDLNCIEIALSYQRLISECNLKQEELGERVGKDRTTINNFLRLLKLPPVIQQALKDNVITMGHAKTLINLPSLEMQLSVFKKIVQDQLSVRKAEELVRNLNAPKETKNTKIKKPFSNVELEKIQEKLSSHFGTKIHVKADQNNKGEIKIPFFSAEDLNRILEILNI